MKALFSNNIEVKSYPSVKRNGLVVYAIFVLFLFSMSSCDNTRVYEEWQDMDGNVWNEDSVCSFTFNLEDSLASYNLNLGIRNTNLYPYQNLWLMTSLRGGNDGFSYQDTIQLKLASKSGEWYGQRSASIYSYVMPLYRQLKFQSVGEYTFTIKHGMRKDALNGVSSVGFRIEQTE